MVSCKVPNSGVMDDRCVIDGADRVGGCCITEQIAGVVVGIKVLNNYIYYLIPFFTL